MNNEPSLALYAVLHELNGREFRRQLEQFPEDVRYYVIIATGIIGLENARRVKGTPQEVVDESEAFVGKLLSTVEGLRNNTFARVLVTVLLNSLKGELRFSCLNCLHFGSCLKLEDETVGGRFSQRVSGEETAQLRREIETQISRILRRTPHVDSDDAQRLCPDFIHAHTALTVGSLFGRYAEIAGILSRDYGINYREFLREVVSLNMGFCERLERAGGGDKNE